MSDQQQLEAHVENCPDCRQFMIDAAGDADDWLAVGEYLRDGEKDEQPIDVAGEAVAPGVTALLDWLDATDDPRMIGRIGPYEIAGVVGAGGHGMVLKAFDPALSRFVALKILHPHHWDDTDARERFAREARAAASITHDNVVEIFGVAESRGIPYFTMQYWRHDSLAKRIAAQGAMEVDEVLRIAVQVAAGLEAAHSQSLVHRDVKPANILLSDGSERVRITDFGLAFAAGDARLTQTGTVAGTPQYMAPEQVLGKPLDARADLFALGSVLYEMCTGRPPFAGDTNYEIMNQIVRGDFTPAALANPKVPDWLAAIVQRLLAARPSDRYPSAAALSADLMACLQGVRQPAGSDPPREIRRLESQYRRSLKPRRRPTGYRAAYVALGVTALLALLFWLQSGQQLSISGRVVDENGKPVPGQTVMGIRKTWTSGLRIDPLTVKTDRDGRFTFKDFAQSGKRYAALMSVARPGYALESIYHLANDGRPLDDVTLRLKPTSPIRFEIRDSRGRGLAGVRISPGARIVSRDEMHASYAHHRSLTAAVTDRQGAVELTWWQRGEQGRLFYQIGTRTGELAFSVAREGSVVLTIPALAGRGQRPMSRIWSPQPSEPSQESITWLTENAIPMRSIDPADTDFSDLEPLRQAIGDARIVQLGEQSHGDGTCFDTKIRLIKFLHEEMGFDVVAFESGLYDCHVAWQAFRAGRLPHEAARLGVFGIWSNTQQLQPLFQYISQRAKTERPLELAGFDCQLTGLASREVTVELERILSLYGGDRVDPDHQRIATTALTVMSRNPRASASSKAPEALTSLANQIKATDDSSSARREVALWQQLLRSYAALATARKSRPSPRQYGIERDRQMAENLNWLADEHYPQRKIIVWAASAHIVRNRKLRQTPGQGPASAAMGDHLYAARPREVYSVGFTAYEGHRGNFGRSFPLSRAVRGTLEQMCSAAGLENAFVDLRDATLPASLKEPLPARPFGYVYEVAPWPQLFDGMVFNRTMKPSIGAR